ncbi:MAG TPA: M48 family metallopeptidase [Vicinamibacterales bacterium]|nr:M48 family metallopeptidase [Vicinamibacterales bacterium]
MTTDGRSARSVVARAALALVLLAGFYVLAVGLAGGLLWIPYAEFMYLHRVDPRIAAACVGAAGAILWSLRPRRDAFVPPGPQLHEAAQPRLFSMIREVAGRTAEAMPAEVFLVPDVNAYVAQRGGFGGFGGQRIMGLGLPLLTVLTVDELKAVLAHEFGHYRGGDVSLGPLVYRTRAAIGRTLQETAGSFIAAPFRAYGRVFLRVSSSVSRHQEFVADRVAADAVGAAPLGSGLRKVHRAAFAFQWYMGSEVVPIIQAGHFPPIAAGFSQFLTAPATRTMLETLEPPAAADDYDSHPPLVDRLDAIGVKGEVESSGAYAVTLLNEVDELEFTLFQLDRRDPPLKRIAWASVTADVSVPMWRKTMETHRSTLKRIEIDQLPSTMQASTQLAADLKVKGEGYVKSEELVRRLGIVIGCAVAVMLYDRGWTCSAGPGEGPVFSRGDQHIMPFDRVLAVVFGREPLDAWAAICNEHDLHGPLG